ncbi:WD40 repeat-like protein [Myriangium duriaei CBS 260.36]|uniref:WD40 repeat-like protein n=1 Tax=Myriangium duriaei CBS 260.36 TaxID=1168546 RepID=A0A9P4MKX9_9PEZI|nr:WD40 repeat-like protein [Myriangium duriaei CBS 260.36]
MSSFFTRPASERKRKRHEDGVAPRRSGRKPTTARTSKKQRQERDESISGSDSDDVDERFEESSNTIDAEESSEEDEDEDATARRTKLANRYLENTRNEILAEGFDAKDIDNELLAQRMGERLKEDTAESKGRLYRWIAEEYAMNGARKAQFSNGSGVLTGVAVCHPFVYTVSKDLRLSKWQLPAKDVPTTNSESQRSAKPKLIASTRGDRSKKRDPRYEQHTAEIYCVAASADGKYVATGGKDKKLVVWDATTLKPLRAFSMHRDAIMSLCFRRGTNQLFTASRDRTIKVWSLNELAYVETLYGHQDEILDIASLNQEHCVTAGARDKTARYWKVVEENQLVFRGGGGSNSLWKKGRHDEVQNGEVDHIDHVERKFFHEGSTDRIIMIDEDTFVTGSDNGGISLWNVHKKKPVFTYPLAHGIEEPQTLEEISAETLPDSTAIPEPQPRWITALASIPYSNIFFSGSWDGHIRAWKISEDRRRIESSGAIAAQNGGIPGDVLYNSINGVYDEEVSIEGCVNDIAVYEMGKNGKDGIGLVAVAGKEHRLGRWKGIKGRNTSVVFQIPKKR